MRMTLVSLTVLSLAATGVAYGQGAVPSPAGGGTAGGVPTLQQEPSGVIPQQDAGPAHAPGSKADAGEVLPKANDNAGTTTTYAPETSTQDVPWPCAQPKVSQISAGTMWSGPNVDAGKDWDQDNQIAELAQKLASRRTSLDDADALIKDFASKAGADKDKQLTKLFVGVLDIINGNRDEILAGIMRYARGQQRLADRISAESDKIGAAQGEALGATGVAVEERNKDFDWDKRIFKDRRQALTYVCETPSLLEKRAFAIAQRIQAQL